MSASRYRLRIAAALVVGLIPAYALAQGRTHSSKKGSLLYFSKVEIRWDSNGNLIQDTFLDVTNDGSQDVIVQFYYVNGDPPLAADPISGERAHPGWNNIDYKTTLTMNQPCYWSLVSGQPKNASKFTVLDPAGPGQLPGRPDPDGGSERVLRGFVLGWAVNSAEQEIRWNHLKGEALLINYVQDAAWEYNAWAFQVVGTAIAEGDQSGSPGILNLDGNEYDQAPGRLLMDFYFDGGSPFNRVTGGVNTVVNTDLTLHPVSVDLRQDNEGPVTVKAEYDVYKFNGNAAPAAQLSGVTQCITCWDQRFLSDISVQLTFATANANKGKARIEGVASTQCSSPSGDPSVKAALLGVAAKRVEFTSGPNAGEVVWAGLNLGIQSDSQGNDESAVIYYDIAPGPGELNAPTGPRTLGNIGSVSVRP